ARSVPPLGNPCFRPRRPGGDAPPTSSWLRTTARPNTRLSSSHVPVWTQRLISPQSLVDFARQRFKRWASTRSPVLALLNEKTTGAASHPDFVLVRTPGVRYYTIRPVTELGNRGHLSMFRMHHTIWQVNFP